MTVVSIYRRDRNDSSTAGGSSQLAGTIVSDPSIGSNSLDGTIDRRIRDYCPGATEKSPLELFAKAARPRRRRTRRDPPTAHLRYGRFDGALEESLRIEWPELSDVDEAELDRLLVKHADIAGGSWTRFGT
jgi:hypothetical protein